MSTASLLSLIFVCNWVLFSLNIHLSDLWIDNAVVAAGSSDKSSLLRVWIVSVAMLGSWIDWCIRKDSCPNFQYFRDVCSTKLLHAPLQLGGPGVILQIDESLFCYKAKYNRGKRASKEQWVFGIADTSHKPTITYMEVV